MPRCRNHACLYVANIEGIAVTEQVIELAAVFGDVVQVEHALEYRLHGGDVPANRRLGTQCFLQVRRAAEMIRVHMGFEYPVCGQAFFLYVFEQRVGGGGGGTPGGGIEVENRIDDDGLRCRRVADDVANGERGLIKKRFYIGF